MLVRVNADNFLICPEIIDLCLDTLESRGLDIVNPFLDNTYPFGCGAEVATMETFRKVERETRSKTTNYREHIFFYAYDHPELFSFDTVVAPPELSRPGLNLSVDTRSEFDLLASFFETQGAQGALKAGLSEIISYFEGESRE